jgi:phage terminase large subunit GpA-like protein
VKDQTALFKSYPGGFVKFVGSNSIADVKSTSARRLIVEEPDDCNLNLRGQGDSIKLIEERGKSFRDAKVLIGGTPSIKGVSSIDDEYDHSDRCEWHVPCPDCGEFQALEWEQVRWVEDEARASSGLRARDPGVGALRVRALRFHVERRAEERGDPEGPRGRERALPRRCRARAQ